MRVSQEERRRRTRTALLEAAARHLSRRGYASLNLDAVAREAGYTRGALYHLFAGKEDLAVAVVEWVQQSWYEAMTPVMELQDGAEALRGVARTHAIYCRRDIARVMTALRIEIGGDNAALSEATGAAVARVVADCAALVTRGRQQGTIPPGVDAETLALAAIGAVEGLVIGLAGREPDDEILAVRAIEGVLGLDGAR